MAAGGWDKKKTAEFKAAFHDFLQHVKIASKDDEGFESLKLYNAQRRFLSEVFSGLENDIRTFVVLKSRQLGISTIVRCLLVYWVYVNDGMKIALVYDTDANKRQARAEIQQFLERLPDSHKIPVTDDNQQFMEFENGSRISFFVAGIKKTKGAGGLGRSVGLSAAGCTEVSSWVDLEGLKSFERSLSDRHPNRLFIWESTARGFNIFHKIWEAAKSDALTKKAIFIGWWAKETSSYAKGTPLFERYGSTEPDEHEQKKIDLVREQYGFRVSMEQLAWYRHQTEPKMDENFRETDAAEGSDIDQQELPWDESEAFLMTGSKFFLSDRLTASTKEAPKFPFRGYHYHMGDDFTGTVLEETRVARHAHLKVWEEPDPVGVYVIGADPAYGSSSKADRHVAQVMRCYSDGVDQVAEFCDPNMTTYQFAWVLAHLAGAYAGDKATARMLIEQNGPGEAVFVAFRELEHLARSNSFSDTTGDPSMRNIFARVRHYLNAPTDSIHRDPRTYHIKTNEQNKIRILERYRDFFHLGQVRIRSIECLEEMRTIVRTKNNISGEGMAKDDRVMATGLAIRAWEEGERKRLVLQTRSRENEAKRRTLTPEDLQTWFSESIRDKYFNDLRRQKTEQERQLRRGTRWNW